MFDEINGSAGIQSNMDSMIVLASSRKAGKNSVFHCIPKDAEQLEFEVGMNEMMIWEDKGPVGSTSLTMLQERIIKAVSEVNQFRLMVSMLEYCLLIFNRYPIIVFIMAII